MVKKLLDFDIGKMKEKNEAIKLEQVSSNDIAITGLSLHFPKADNAEEFWNIIENKVDCISDIPEGRRKDLEALLAYRNIKEASFARKAYLKEIDKFDYSYFGLSPKEASLLDPNQRLFLETAWEAVEDAGYGGNRLKGSRTGVYLGFGNEMLYMRLLQEFEQESVAVALPGNLPPIIAGRVSYLLDLKGPSILVDTTCSSALVAVHYACQGIRSGECNAAIAGTVSFSLLPIDAGFRVGIEASDGRAKTFDDSSDGTGSGEGAAAIMLKPLTRAIDDGDNIYAVIKGSAINQDGSSMGITAPNPAAQEDVICRAWKNAGIDPETITYIEAHGTGTKLGDPIEIDGIKRAFSRFTDKKSFCGVGSVKTNIGHLDNAAGLAGLLKAVLALKHRKLPPTLYFNRPNRQIPFVDSPVYVCDRVSEWTSEGQPRRCGVSSFGFSGTNCHIVLEEAPERSRVNAIDKKPKALTISARSKAALKANIKKYKDYIKDTDCDIRDICFTANTGRGHYGYRLAITAEDMEDLRNILNGLKEEALGESNSKVFYGSSSVIQGTRPVMEAGELTADEAEKLSKSADVLLGDFLAGGKTDAGILGALLRLYVSGAEIEWDKLYRNEAVRRVSVPVYPFERKRCWLEVPVAESLEAGFNPEKMFLEAGWENRELQNLNSRKQGCVLVLGGNEKRTAELVKQLENRGIEVIKACMGDRFGKNEDGSYTVSGSRADYERLLKEIRDKNAARIIHALSLGTSAIQGLEAKLDKGLYSLFKLSGALINSGVKYGTELIFLTANANEVTGAETGINPDNAAAAGFIKAAGMENYGFGLKCIDADESTSTGKIIEELGAGIKESLVAYREDKRYVELIKRADINEAADCENVIRKDGVYIITGGLGGIGLEVAKHFASMDKVKLIMLNRTSLPEKSQWAEILDKSEDAKLKGKLAKILELEDSGSEVICLKADVSKREELQPALASVRERYGRLDGIIHAAGTAGDGFLIKKAEGKFKEVIAPKINGTWLLEELTEEDRLDFFILFSSFISITGEAGQTDYTAANAYMDSFCAYRRKTGRRTMTINWTGWKETGMSVDYGINTDGVFKAMPTSAAVKAFDIILKKDVSRVLIGEINFDNELMHNDLLPINVSKEIKEEIKNAEKSGTGKQENCRKPMKTKVRLKGRAEAASYTETEQKLAQIWGECLGIEEINIYDSFFDLGGHSLNAAMIAARVRSELNFEISVSGFYEAHTIEKLSSQLQNAQAPETETAAAIEPDGGRPSKPEDFDALSPEAEENLKLEYFFKKNGELDLFVNLLDCGQQMMYFVLKKELGSISGYSHLFIQDFVFSIYQQTEGEILDIEFDLYPIREDVFKFSCINSNAEEAMAGIERLLDAGKQVIINTNTRRTPFNIEFGGFDWPYDEKDGQSHNFLALAHDRENLYYVEMPELINEKNYIPYKGNKYVGMVRKTDLIPAFELYVNYGTIAVDKNNLYKKSNLRDCIGLSLKNNRKPAFYKDGLKITSGLKAIDLLIGMCDAGCLDLNSKGNKYLTGLHNFLRWKFHVIGARRKLLSYAFEDYAEDCDSSIRSRLVKTLEDAYHEWFKCKELAVRKYMVEKDYIVGKEFKELFISIRRLEEEILENLSKLWR